MSELIFKTSIICECSFQFLSCLQRGAVLFAACNSFACNVHSFYSQVPSRLQSAGVLFALSNFFACNPHIFLQFPFCLQCIGVDIFDVFFVFARNSFICSVFSLLKRCPLWATVEMGRMSPNLLFSRKLVIFLSGNPLFQTEAKVVSISCLGIVILATFIPLIFPPSRAKLIRKRSESK